jgi:hypothetical protein
MITDFVHVVASTLAASLWIGALVWGAALVALAIIPSRRARVRYAILAVALAMLAIAPILDVAAPAHGQHAYGRRCARDVDRRRGRRADRRSSAVAHDRASDAADSCGGHDP